MQPRCRRPCRLAPPPPSRSARRCRRCNWTIGSCSAWASATATSGTIAPSSKASGGRFAHHDGGLEDKLGALDASLAAADLVICQTGCISHNAYWRVKDFCKRTGKRCLFVENPSTSSLVRELRQNLAPSETPAEDDSGVPLQSA
jgi:hypothetical protein